MADCSTEKPRQIGNELIASFKSVNIIRHLLICTTGTPYFDITASLKQESKRVWLSLCFYDFYPSLQSHSFICQKTLCQDK